MVCASAFLCLRFAFNCGSTNSLECKVMEDMFSVALYFMMSISFTANKIMSNSYRLVPYHAIPSIIAVNMILAAASGGIVAISIAVWAQVSCSHDMHPTFFQAVFHLAR